MFDTSDNKLKWFSAPPLSISNQPEVTHSEKYFKFKEEEIYQKTQTNQPIVLSDLNFHPEIISLIPKPKLDDQLDSKDPQMNNSVAIALKSFN